MKCADAMLIGYITVGFATFGYLYTDDWSGASKYDQSPGSILAGVFWPGYWTGKAAIHSMEYIRKEVAKSAEPRKIYVCPNGRILSDPFGCAQ